MTNNSKNLGLAILTISMLMSLTVSSCADKDFDWEAARMQSPIYKYMKNFEESFGEIDPEMSWDFTEYANSAASTRAAGDYFEKDQNWYYVPSEISNYINNNYPEQALKGDPEPAVSFKVPNDGEFTIYPVYQGLALLWDVYIKIGDGDDAYETKIWQKSEDIQRTVVDNPQESDWLNLQDYESNGKGFPQYDGNNVKYKNYTSYGDNFYWYDGYSTSDYNNRWVFGSGDGKGFRTTTCISSPWGTEDFASTKGIRVKPLKFKLPTKYVGKDVEIYLLITGVQNGYYNTSPGRKQSSMGAQCKVMKPGNNIIQNVFPGKYVTMIGFEDGSHFEKSSDQKYLHDGVFSNKRISVYDNNKGRNVYVKEDSQVKISDSRTVTYKKTDWDYNDLVLMVVSNQEFKEVVVEEDEISKRYMVEDLGAVDNSDIDFNDIVVDFKQVYRNEHDKGSSVSHEGFPRITQEAKIYALGGTLDLTLYVGDPNQAESTWTKIFTKSTAGADILNPNYNEELASLDYKIMYNTNMSKNGDGYYNPDDYIASVTMTTIQGTDNIDRTNKVAVAKNVWRPDLNNLIVKVVNPKGNTQSSKDYDQDITDGTTLITFPEKGRIPKIIAVPTTQEWNNERISVFTHDRTGCRLNLRKVFEQSTGQTTEK